MEINGFVVLQTRFTEKCKAGHYLYIKEHSAKDQDDNKPLDKTLFVVNIPPYCTKESLRCMFSPCGKILHLHLHDKPTKGVFSEKSKYFKELQLNRGFKVGYIVFKGAGSVKKAMKLPYDEPLIISTPDKVVSTGVRKWCEEYENSQLDVNLLQKEIDNYMEKYDKYVAEEKTKALENEGVPDDEGWITVTRHSKKNKPTPRTEAMEAKLTDKEKKKKTNMELKNFYTFQSRESKRTGKSSGSFTYSFLSILLNPCRTNL